MQSYDEDGLVDRVARVDPVRRTAFALSCAQRLLPLYQRFVERSGSADPGKLIGVADRLWAVLQGQPATNLAADQRLAESLVPDDEDDSWVLETGYAQSAAAAVAYAVRSWLTGDPQEAAWAARQLYEAADYAAQQVQVGLYGNRQAEAAVQESEIVQGALAAIADDLARVEGDRLEISALRDIADEEGRAWSRSLP